MKTLIGRQEEQEILRKALASTEAEMVAVIGRRRVGKTYLVEQVYQDRIFFQITGLQKQSMQKQLRLVRSLSIIADLFKNKSRQAKNSFIF